MFKKLWRQIKQLIFLNSACKVENRPINETPINDTEPNSIAHVATSNTSVNILSVLNKLDIDLLGIYEPDDSISLSHRKFGHGSVIGIREAKSGVYFDVIIEGETSTFNSKSFNIKNFSGAYVPPELAKKYITHQKEIEKKLQLQAEIKQSFERQEKLEAFHDNSNLSNGNRWKKYGNDTSHAYSPSKGGGKGLHH
ncbi:hypothetical protein VCR31J2_1310690 [Vibrio coralliirubri]|uniref:Uncharacterized protein n=1 Tax=Vibrio coralliirubri TaxID=1516159 RepID=A0AA87C1Z6_9VIBR|nr:hypothetical protein [Vibrio coralliirubri]CDT79081.1 hypothetical protein VCR31J2_1310690 [Vibrio coralliirubri]